MATKGLSDMMVIQKFKDEIRPVLRLTFPHLSDYEIDMAVDYSCIKRMKNGQAYIDNNYTNVKVDTTVLQLTEYILSR